MKKTALFLLLLWPLAPAAGQGVYPGEKLLVRISGPPPLMEELARRPLDFASMAVKETAEAVVSQEELDALLSQGYQVAILQRESDLQGFPLADYYHTYEATCAALLRVEQQYPHLAKRFQIGWSTLRGLPIYALKISDHPELDEDETAVLVDGMHHAREVIGNEICLAFIDHLLTGYGRNARATSWVDDYEIWVIPILNPEGYQYIVENNLESPWWRKNLRDNNLNGQFDQGFDGVDLNRNYDFNWTKAGSGNPADWDYRGPWAFSEEETLAKRELAIREKFAASVTYHSYGEVIYYEWSWPDSGARAPDHAVLSKMAADMSQKIKKVGSSGTYASARQTGASQSSPWMYGVLGTFEFLVEVGTTHLPMPADIKPLVEANLEGLFWFLDRLKGSGISGRIIDWASQEPVEATVEVRGVDDFNYIQPRHSDPRTGRFVRFLEPGTYTLKITAPGYPARNIRLDIGDSLREVIIPLAPTRR